MRKVLMVCMGNICRSPMAEAVARRMAEDQGLGGWVEFDSAGTHGFHAGEPPDDRACKIAALRGYKLAGLRARKVTIEDFGHFDLILAMDRQNLAALERLCPLPYLGKVRLFLEYGSSGEISEVPDPYYGNLSGFERVLDLCEDAVQGLLADIRRAVGSQ